MSSQSEALLDFGDTSPSDTGGLAQQWTVSDDDDTQQASKGSLEAGGLLLDFTVTTEVSTSEQNGPSQEEDLGSYFTVTTSTDDAQYIPDPANFITVDDAVITSDVSFQEMTATTTSTTDDSSLTTNPSFQISTDQQNGSVVKGFESTVGVFSQSEAKFAIKDEEDDDEEDVSQNVELFIREENDEVPQTAGPTRSDVTLEAKRVQEPQAPVNTKLDISFEEKRVQEQQTPVNTKLDVSFEGKRVQEPQAPVNTKLDISLEGKRVQEPQAPVNTKLDIALGGKSVTESQAPGHSKVDITLGGKRVPEPQAPGHSKVDIALGGKRVPEPQAPVNSKVDIALGGKRVQEPQAPGNTKVNVALKGKHVQEPQAAGNTKVNVALEGKRVQEPQAVGNTKVNVALQGKRVQEPQAPGNTKVDVALQGKRVQEPQAAGNTKVNVALQGKRVQEPQAAGNTKVDVALQGKRVQEPQAAGNTKVNVALFGKRVQEPQAAAAGNTKVNVAVEGKRVQEPLKDDKKEVKENKPKGRISALDPSRYNFDRKAVKKEEEVKQDGRTIHKSKEEKSFNAASGPRPGEKPPPSLEYKIKTIALKSRSDGKPSAPGFINYGMENGSVAKPPVQKQAQTKSIQLAVNKQQGPGSQPQMQPQQPATVYQQGPQQRVQQVTTMRQETSQQRSQPVYGRQEKFGPQAGLYGAKQPATFQNQQPPAQPSAVYQMKQPGSYQTQQTTVYQSQQQPGTYQTQQTTVYQSQQQQQQPGARQAQPTAVYQVQTNAASYDPQAWDDEAEEGVYESQPQLRTDVIRESDCVDHGAELPSQGMARSVRDRFLTGRLENRVIVTKREMTPPHAVEGGVYESEPQYNQDVVRCGEEVQNDILPQQGMARTMATRFKQMEKQGGSDIPARTEFVPFEQQVHAGVFENEPIEVTGVVKSGEVFEDVVPQRGAARTMATLFKQMSLEKEPGAPRGKRAITPDHTSKGEYVTEPRGYLEQYEGQAESGVFESEPQWRDDVIRADEWEQDLVPERGAARSMAAHFLEMGRPKNYVSPGGYKEFTPPRESEATGRAYGVYENEPEVYNHVTHYAAQQEDIRPQTGMARNLVTQFRQFGSGSNTPKDPRSRRDFTPPRDGGGVYENEPTQFIPDYNNPAESGILESEPVMRTDVIRENEGFGMEQELPERGLARNMVSTWRQKESSQPVTPTGSGLPKEFTPPREEPRVIQQRIPRTPKTPLTGMSDGSVHPFDLPEQYQPQAEATVFESEPERRDDVVREDDTDWMAGMPRADTTKKVLAKFRNIQQQASTASNTVYWPPPQAPKAKNIRY